jgi:aryl-alcohol dehydrogenase (NADP+)
MKKIGSSTLEVSGLNLGGNTFGWTASEAESHAVLDAYVDAGGNFIDTADVYSEWKPGNSGGESESIIGSWLQRRGNRKDVIIATKVSKLSKRPGLGAANIAAAVDESLKRLKSDYIDLYYAHADDPETPLEETLTAFDQVVKAGKVRYIAASNYSQERLAEALSISKSHGLVSYIGLQPHFNLLEQGEFPVEYRDFCAANNVGVMPYYGVARGFLTGKYQPGISVDSARAGGVEKYCNSRGWKTLEIIKDLAQRHGVSYAAISLAWLRVQTSITAPIASARIVSQLPDLMQTPTLSSEEIATLTLAGSEEAAV